jgi:hypothetical protein
MTNLLSERREPFDQDRDQTVPAIASSSTTALAFDTDDVQGELAERT